VNNLWDDTVASPLVSEPEARPGRAYLVIVRGANVGQVHPVLAPEMVIGRAAGTDVRLDDVNVSRFHCKFRHDGNGGVVIEDLASRNGTFCNGERVAPGMRPLVEGDRIQIGTTTVLRFTFEETVEAVMTPSPEEIPVRDALTGAYSGRYFVEQLKTDVAYALSHRSPLSLVLLHIDRFAELCLPRGPSFCDEMIKTVANAILDKVRKDDLLTRFNGGEFGLMSRSASPGDTFMLAERLRKSSAGLTIPTADGGSRKLTLSLAVASLNELRIENANDLLLAANTALHRARSQGGDRVVLCTQDLLQEPKAGGKV
jgi:diguanylate cyclase (GGDEF)-like protein